MTRQQLLDIIAQAARELEQMGMEFNRDWREARDDLMELGKTEPHVAYSQFAAVCERHSQFTATRDWVKRIAPYANFVAGVLKTVVPMVGPALNLAYGEQTVKSWGLPDRLNLMKEGTGKLLQDIEVSDPSRVRQGVLSEVERSGILALHALLRELDPNHEKLGLWRIPTYTGNYLWLCRRHYEQMQPKIPDKIERVPDSRRSYSVIK